MYFITPSKPDIFLIGIYENQLFGFGENEKKKLCIYQKSIFDIGDWEVFFTTDVTVMKTECCDTGLHVASNIHKTRIWIAARVNQSPCVYLIDIQTKKFFAYKMLKEIDQEVTDPEINLCCKCLMPIIRFQGFFWNAARFLITLRRCTSTEKVDFRLFFAVTESQHCIFYKNMDNITLDSPPLSSNIAVSVHGQLLSVREKSEDGRIKSLSVMHTENTIIARIPDDSDSVWHDITFCSDHFNVLYGLTRQQKEDTVILRIYIISITYPDEDMRFLLLKSYTVDAKFPSFESTPFYFSYQCGCVDASTPLSIFTEFIVFQAPEGIVTVPLRMLSLSESAYLSLSRIPEPSIPVTEVKLSVFQRIQKFLRRKSKKVKDPWMSLNFIKKTLGLSNDFELK
uniref:Uncharacterized protein n=1 Tax=Panagrolaimus sp. ES5 TaxID=591445 RepID=A0AC34FIF3_9BILA